MNGGGGPIIIISGGGIPIISGGGIPIIISGGYISGGNGISPAASFFLPPN